MLSVLGPEYLIAHCVRESEERFYKRMYFNYSTEMLKVIAECLGAEITKRYADIVEPKKEEVADGDAIVLEVIEKAGLQVTR